MRLTGPPSGIPINHANFASAAPVQSLVMPQSSLAPSSNLNIPHMLHLRTRTTARLTQSSCVARDALLLVVITDNAISQSGSCRRSATECSAATHSQADHSRAGKRDRDEGESKSRQMISAYLQGHNAGHHRARERHSDSCEPPFARSGACPC